MTLAGWPVALQRPIPNLVDFVQVLQSTYPIVTFAGGLFDMSDSDQEIAFRFAVDRVNSDRTVLPNTRLTAQIERIPHHDSFYAAKQGTTGWPI